MIIDYLRGFCKMFSLRVIDVSHFKMAICQNKTNVYPYWRNCLKIT